MLDPTHAWPEFQKDYKMVLRLILCLLIIDGFLDRNTHEVTLRLLNDKHQHHIIVY